MMRGRRSRSNRYGSCVKALWDDYRHAGAALAALLDADQPGLVQGVQGTPSGIVVYPKLP